MTNYLIPDMDDISLDNPDANGLNYAFYLKGKFPKFKITLFCIPGRATIEWLELLDKNSEWISVCMHGWNHDEEEEITQEMLDEWPFDPYYKGPNWKVNKKEKELLLLSDWQLVTKQWTLRTPGVVHGHCWIKSDWERLEKKITAETEFKFIYELI